MRSPHIEFQSHGRMGGRGGYSFNSLLVNHYRNGRGSMGWHADDERELDPGKRPRENGCANQAATQQTSPAKR